MRLKRMNKRQKQVIQSQLNDEKATLNRLKGIYQKALDDVNDRLAALKGRAETENLQSVIYQIQYQEALKKQINGILDTLNGDQFNTISEYLAKSYESGFVGVMYDIHGQGVPLIFPIDQDQVIQAVTLDTKLSKPLYNKLGEDVNLLKKRVANNISRGIAQGQSYSDIAKNIAVGMVGNYARMNGGALYNAMRITRTEAHRISQQAAYDALKKAKDNGADVVKQWDATLDKRTRPSHARVDGEIRELDEPFSNGLMKPGDPRGRAAEVINCRCQLLQRARCALDEDELDELKERAAYFGLDKTANFEEFRQKYMSASIANSENMGYNDNILLAPIESKDEKYNSLLTTLAAKSVDYNPVKMHSVRTSESEMIKLLSGGDQTGGSCASVGLAYIGQKQGWDVLDFRDGESRRFFANSANLLKISEANGVKSLRATGASSMTVGSRLLGQCELGKEYYLCVGQHAAIVRKTDDGVLQYLELQSAYNSGWINFNGNPRYTLKNRFGCSNASSASSYYDFMIDIDESDFSTDDFKSLLGYINTSANEQRKGLHGTIK